VIPRGICSAFFTFAAIPLFIVAWILYYYVGNPELDFLPGSATVSWWLDFFGRQLLTLELARVSQWIIVDILTLKTKATIELCGSLVTLLLIQSKGWPFLATSWACIDLCILHGDNKFPVHWLYWTDIAIYSEANSGSYIINAELYLRVLLCLVLAGVATSVKRTIVAVNFGRKMFGAYALPIALYPLKKLTHTFRVVPFFRCCVTNSRVQAGARENLARCLSFG
jgi:hypothetical protein